MPQFDIFIITNVIGFMFVLFFFLLVIVNNYLARFTSVLKFRRKYIAKQKNVNFVKDKNIKNLKTLPLTSLLRQ